ncbi:unnamed protein product, partial [Laminaria digitata]
QPKPHSCKPHSERRAGQGTTPARSPFMAKEKGAAPSRRLPSRSARASLEPDSSNDQQEVSPEAGTAPTSPRDDDDLAGSTTNDKPGTGASSVGPTEAQDNNSSSVEEQHTSNSNGPSSNGSAGDGSSAYPSRSATQQQEGEAPIADNAAAASAASSTTTATPTGSRGRGRPRKKPLELKVDTAEKPDAPQRGAGASPRPSVAAVAAAATPATPKTPASLARQAS